MSRSDQYHAIGSPWTIQSSGGGIFQKAEALDLRRIDIVDASRHGYTVYHDQWLVAWIKRGRTPYDKSDALAGLATVLVDTDILIKAYRGDKKKEVNLKKLEGKYQISVINACELINGAKKVKQRREFIKVLQHYFVALINDKISQQAFSLYKKYSFKNDLKISDSFIAATAISNDLFLYTDNKKDFEFIDEIKFYKER